MSGFVAIRLEGGRPVSSRSLADLARHLQWRGPDGGGTWHDGPVGLVQTRFRTTDEGEDDPGPVERLGVVIAGDVRLDDRASVVARLASSDGPPLAEAGDLTLVLHAYLRHGEACLEQLAGDFSFAVWDGRRRRLFAACDQMGVVPLHWARNAGALVVGNTLHGLLAHPEVEDGIDQEMIAEQLAVGIRITPGRTCYRSIRRLPPGHSLTADEGGVRVQRYWAAPVGPPRPVRRKPGAYVEEARELLARAVGDRWRGASAATHLSGGMDASSVAVWLARLMEGRAAGLKAYTHVVTELGPDPEGPLAELTARRAGIAWEAVPIEPILSGDEAVPPRVGPPEPSLPPQLSIRGAIEHRASRHARVLFTGYGGDALFVSAHDPPFAEPVVPRLLGELRDAAFCAGSDPGVWRLWRDRPRGGAGRDDREIAADRLLNPEFASRFGIQGRRSAWWSQRPAPSVAGLATHPVWRARMTEADPDFTGVPLRHRFPFFDLRLVGFATALPRFPWRGRKLLLRLATGSLLPPEVRWRPKAGFGTELMGAFLRTRGPRPWMYELLDVAGGEEYFDRAAAIRCIENGAAQDKVTLRRLVFLFCVAHWLRDRPRVKV